MKYRAHTDAHGAKYEAWTDGYAIGFKVTRDGREEIVCLNPSSESDDAKSNVFMYHGRPESGEPIVFLDLFQ